MAGSEQCPFCNISAARILQESALAIALSDAFPVSRGHCLVIPRRHVRSWFETSEDERREMLRLLDDAREALRRASGPDGFNIGINDGAAAGQTVPHLHVHLIPRYTGDARDPRGGVRWVLPERADYWSSPR
jgi:diadenosine tetraphosphate (Ap4A) HIT family hydrolase